MNPKGRFLRSKSSVEKTEKKKHSKEDDGHESEPDEHHRNLSRKQVLNEEQVSNEFINKTLNHYLDVLMAYFQSDYNQNATNSNFLETSDLSGHVYYQLAQYTKQLLAKVSD